VVTGKESEKRREKVALPSTKKIMSPDGDSASILFRFGGININGGKK
jgi:hypothetical protein